MASKIRDAYDVSVAIERQAMRLWQSLRAAHNLDSPEFTRQIRTRVVGSGVLAGLVDELNALKDSEEVFDGDG